MSIANNVLDAIDILVQNGVSNLEYNKTIRGKIAEVLDTSIGQYKIQYQNSYFTAYTSDSNATYTKGSEVYIEILSGDFEKNALILGTVRRLGSNYLTIIERLDRYSDIGAAFKTDNEIALCSYKNESQILYLKDANNNLWDIDELALSEYAITADTLKLGAKIKNNLVSEQRIAAGNFGIKLIVKYYDEAEINHNENSKIIKREYIFDINDMTGQPYKYTVPVDQYALFTIDAKNFIEIESITAFCENFIISNENKDNDIWFTDLHLQFLQSLTDEQLANSYLTIDTPEGNYFTTNSDAEDKLLKAKLKIRGKTVNYEYQQIDFYWFRRNLEVFAGHEKFSPYGGNGWELLNTKSLNTYSYRIKRSLCSAQENRIRCIAVFKDNGQSVAVTADRIIKNLDNKPNIKINSSMGTFFSFNTGMTTLSVTGYENLDSQGFQYIWTESINGGAAAYLDNDSPNLQVEIATPAANSLTYECSVFKIVETATGLQKEFIGTASILLINSKENSGITLVIKNATQIFKYDSYGVSPASNNVAIADRIIIPILSFDLYDKQGQLIDISDADKHKYMSIKWIWPSEVADIDPDRQDQLDNIAQRRTMLAPITALERLSLLDVANNKTIIRYGSTDSTFAYGIKDIYSAEYANSENAKNNIILEVDYQGEHLVAHTNFTFTKEGELGTNGTKYIARITPRTGFQEVFLIANTENIELCAITNNNEIQHQNEVYHNLEDNKIRITDYLQAELWDGSSQNIIDSVDEVIWSLSTSTKRRKNSLFNINSDNEIIFNNSNSENYYAPIIQICIKYGELKYYATYPLICTNNLFNNKLLYIDGGYREVMYESDGTRGKYNGLPFSPKLWGPAGKESLSSAISSDNWIISWLAAAQFVANSWNQFTIEPPSYYMAADENGYFIKLEYQNNIHTYLPIELYLNRYGMSAMNDWDGNSIQINNDGGYILSPQVGAGHKNDDNSFTGITIGETFQDVNNKEVGMFGYYQGQRSLFLDANTGNAEFGISGKGQIRVQASGDEEGVIDSGDYHKYHLLTREVTRWVDNEGNILENQNNPGPNAILVVCVPVYDAQGVIQEGEYTPKRDANNNLVLAGTGLKIKFTSTGTGAEKGPYIKYGSGDFEVDALGHITARGGGTVGGWTIEDRFLRSTDEKTTLFSRNGVSEMQLSASVRETSTDVPADPTIDPIAYSYTNQEGQKEDVCWASKRSTRFRIGSQFLINEDGAFISTAGKIGGWHINNDKLIAYSKITEKLRLNSNGSIWGPSANYNFSPNKRVWEITNNGVAYFTDIKIKNKNSIGRIDATGQDENNFLWYGKVTENGTTRYPKIFELTDSDCSIGGWNITGTELNSGIVHFDSSAAGKTNSKVLSVGEVFSIYGNGAIDATSGSIGGCTLNSSGLRAPGGTTGLTTKGLELDGHILKAREMPFPTSIWATVTPDLDFVTIQVPTYDAEGNFLDYATCSSTQKFCKGITLRGTLRERFAWVAATTMDFDEGRQYDDEFGQGSEQNG